VDALSADEEADDGVFGAEVDEDSVEGRVGGGEHGGEEGFAGGQDFRDDLIGGRGVGFILGGDMAADALLDFVPFAEGEEAGMSVTSEGAELGGGVEEAFIPEAAELASFGFEEAGGLGGGVGGDIERAGDDPVLGEDDGQERVGVGAEGFEDGFAGLGRVIELGGIGPFDGAAVEDPEAAEGLLDGEDFEATRTRIEDDQAMSGGWQEAVEDGSRDRSH